MPRFQSVATLAFSLVALILVLCAALVGADRDSLYADPGEPEAAAPLTVVPGR